MEIENEKKQALMKHLELDVLDESDYCEDNNLFDVIGEGEYMVLTDAEADEAWEESLDNYLEDCVYPDLAEPLKSYFDDEAWKRDARFDGRGHSLSSYDGEEHEVNVGDTWYYIYRTN